MPRNVEFKDIKNDELFATENEESDLAIYLKQGDAGVLYKGSFKGRGGMLSMCPAPKPRRFLSEDQVYRLDCT